jgi:hypothetical protein
VARRIRNREKVEGWGNKRAARQVLSATLNRGDSFSLTGSPDVHNYVKVRGGRLIWPIFQDGLPYQLFDAFINPLKSEAANRILIVSFEINVDLLGCGSKLRIATHRWRSLSIAPRCEDQHHSRYPVLARFV